ncbi:hypothetical protein PsB1_0756 [Candidatus Phycosocius spiralis]|uniref:Uncharacterized protein n=2 Tax=Candidatus Phycosocius spiralis TaxID=2815099 RepID=A0ABQ4PU96_9PROT|nr:hypothetical protein PsB1_0756 [Candidatus Phycosocius spiralis]
MFPHLLIFGMMCATSMLGLSVHAQAGSQKLNKADKPHQIPVAKLFPYYDLYLSLPPEDRDGFTLKYFEW